MDPRVNEGPREWPNTFAKTRFRHTEVLFHVLLFITGTENIVQYIEDFVIKSFVISSFHCRKIFVVVCFE